MDFLVRQWCIRRTRKSIVRLYPQPVDKFRYVMCASTGETLGEFRMRNALPLWDATINDWSPNG
ncbi:hypothetical protein Rcae01_00993 [Novipirellula caenicola]|uniref:Uncharacterized protein n=1 Tax=Novipirellula caenicola TaxID=1536901 RepID=A0ABP9VMZ3_9BACT